MALPPLSLEDAWLIEEPIPIVAEELGLHIGAGVAFAVGAGSDRVGIVCVCTGVAARTPTSARSDASLALRVEGPTAVTFEGLVLLGLDADDLLAGAAAVELHEGGVLRVQDGIEEVVVGAAHQRVRAQGERLLARVVRDLAREGMHPGEVLALDRHERLGDDAAPVHLLG